MRKLLLASVATLGTTGVLASSAWAQAQGQVVGAPNQGQVAFPPAPSPLAGANNNNNYQAPALPGPVANPTPGTIVVHINGKVQTNVGAAWTSADVRTFTAPTGSPGATPVTTTFKVPTGGFVAGSTVTVTVPNATSTAAILGNNGTGVAKLGVPQQIDAFARLYAGVDGMATNGLRYGAAIELRENFSGQPSGASASTYSSLSTVYVRRAFTYIAGENWGLFRLGMGDGVIGIFDNGVTTFQFLPTGNFNGDDVQSIMAGSAVPAFIFLSQGGAEYDNAKAVYLSPQIAGFDFGIQYAPNTSNGYGMSGSNLGSLGNSLTGSGTGTGIACNTATTGCPSLSSGPGALDGSRIINQFVVGARYQGTFGGLGVLAYGAYELSGVSDYTGQAAVMQTPTGLALGPGGANLGLSQALITAGSTYRGRYAPLSFGNGGIALTYSGFTVGGNVIGGQKNGYFNPKPQGGAQELGFIIGTKYVQGPLTVGIAGLEYWNQGNVQMSGITQHRARELSTGFSYTVAPGYIVYGEYNYSEQTQNGVNQITGAALSNANNNIRGQGFVFGQVVNF